MIPWRPIAELPDELKDGREVLLWDGTWAIVGVWRNGWQLNFARDIEEFANPTHFAEITLP